ncbi:PKD domain-containing protein [Pedobacter yulinensis]|uniref:PKD domain-containing protein n=1 Tax=Pedobacter yulinensis TaxID=2126353 RepID=A0A2T3HLY5_9SPHI|nr:PKD domain-containing protein [Pedobacter yulinensis]PST83462.1 PKD domain-containing protein [Pedobacter yulinensis]
MTDTNTSGRAVNSNSTGYIILYILVAILLLAGGIFLFKSSIFDNKAIDAQILKDEIDLNEDLVYTDNTKGAKKWLWEFGNGDKSTTQNGSYRYRKAGAYIVRLTVDGELKQQYPVNVRDTVRSTIDTLVTISGPTSGVINEQVRLEAEGNAKIFQWSFGETGRVDITGRTALYTYRAPGRYWVKLMNDQTRRPLYHVIEITDPNADLNGEIVAPGEGERKVVDDIRARLQAIANGADFNTHYYYLVRKYMCNKEKVTVAIDQNGEKKQKDFYSYCMGLTFGGEIVIDEAQVTVAPNSACATLLNIKQHTANTAAAEATKSSK